MLTKKNVSLLLVNIFAVVMGYLFDIQAAAPFMAAGFIIAALP